MRRKLLELECVIFHKSLGIKRVRNLVRFFMILENTNFSREIFLEDLLEYKINIQFRFQAAFEG